MDTEAAIYDLTQDLLDARRSNSSSPLGRHEDKHPPVPARAATTDIRPWHKRSKKSRSSSEYSLGSGIASVHGLSGISPPSPHSSDVHGHGRSQVKKLFRASTTGAIPEKQPFRADSPDSTASESGSASISARSDGLHRRHSGWKLPFLRSHSEHSDGVRKGTPVSINESTSSHPSLSRPFAESIPSDNLTKSPEVLPNGEVEIPPLHLLDGAHEDVTRQPSAPMDVALLPFLIEDYTNRIGRVENGETKVGGYSDVIQARDNVTGKLIAVKCLRTFGMNEMDPGSPEGKDRMQKRLYRELRVLRMVPHPRVAHLLGHAVLEERLALVTQWYSEGNLSEYLERHPQASKPRLVSQVCQGLTHLHFHDPPIAHSDIKPANVLIDAKGDAALSDFGLAKLLDGVRTGLTTMNAPGYSLNYCAPEMLDGGAGTLAADVYAFACLAFEVLTGKLPFYEHTNQNVLVTVKYNKTIPSRLDSPDLSDGVWKLLVQCWSPEPESRPNMMEFMQELKNLGWYRAGS